MAFKSTRKSRRHRTPQQEKSPEKDAFFQPLEPKNPVTVQPKLTVGAPDDKYEQEADNVANQVVSNNAAGKSPAIQSKADSRMEKDREIQEKPDKGARPQVQRKVEGEEEPVQAKSSEEEEPLQAMSEEEEPVQTKSSEEEEPLQAKSEEEEEPLQAKEEEEESLQAKPEEEEPLQAMEEEEEPVQAKSKGASSARPDLANRLRSRAGKGRQLGGQAKEKMESGFGRDFSGVNVHTDAAADEMNRELGARAFARGQDVYFKSGEYNPDTAAGQRLLAHELTHTVQQGGGAAKTGAAGVQRNWDKSNNWPSLQGDAVQIKLTLKFTGAVLNKSGNAGVNTTGLATAAKTQIEQAYKGKVQKEFMGVKVIYDVDTVATVRTIAKLSDLSFGKEHILVVLDDSHPKVNGTYGRGPFYGSIVYLNEKHIAGMISGADANTIPHEVGHTAGLKHLMEKGEESSLIGKAIKRLHETLNPDNIMWRGGGHPSYSGADADQKLTETNSEQLEEVSRNISDDKLNKVNFFSFLDLMKL